MEELDYSMFFSTSILSPASLSWVSTDDLAARPVRLSPLLPSPSSGGAPLRGVRTPLLSPKCQLVKTLELGVPGHVAVVPGDMSSSPTWLREQAETRVGGWAERIVSSNEAGTPYTLFCCCTTITFIRLASAGSGRWGLYCLTPLPRADETVGAVQ